jgi:hypothetical protein
MGQVKQRKLFSSTADELLEAGSLPKIKSHINTLTDHDHDYHSRYRVSHGPISKEELDEMRKLRNISRVRSHDDDQLNTVCFSGLHRDIEYCTDRHGRKPEYLWFAFNYRYQDESWSIDYGDWYDDDDDDWDDEYYDEDDVDYPVGIHRHAGVIMLTEKECRTYFLWLKRTGLVTTFNVSNYFTKGFMYWKTNKFTSMNHLYHDWTLLRYAHEGQNLVRRMLVIDKEFGCDPLLTVILAHWTSDGHYNTGHSIMNNTGMNPICGYNKSVTFTSLKTALLVYYHTVRKIKHGRRSSMTRKWAWDSLLEDYWDDLDQLQWPDKEPHNLAALFDVKLNIKEK